MKVKPDCGCSGLKTRRGWLRVTHSRSSRGSNARRTSRFTDLWITGEQSPPHIIRRPQPSGYHPGWHLAAVVYPLARRTAQSRCPPVMAPMSPTPAAPVKRIDRNDQRVRPNKGGSTDEKGSGGVPQTPWTRAQTVWALVPCLYRNEARASPRPRLEAPGSRPQASSRRLRRSRRAPLGRSASSLA